MDVRSQCSKYDGDAIVDAGHCPKCATSLKFFKNSNQLAENKKPTEPAKVSSKSVDSNYVMQIVSIGVRSDNVYEAQMVLAPEVDMSSIKITVKGSNLRVNVCKPLNDLLASQLQSETREKSILNDLLKKTTKHCENLLIPEGIDGEKVRAVVDNKHRMLVLTAPAMKPSKARKKYMNN